MTIAHHPRAETLAAFSAGALEAAFATVVAAHLDLCAQCRGLARDFEALGGACLDAAEPVELAADAIERFWSMADSAPEASHPPRGGLEPVAHARPLRELIAGGLGSVKWRPAAPGLSQCRLGGEARGALRLLKIAPGTRIPRHAHGDQEITLVLEGAYDDERGRYARGDLAEIEGDAEHAPLAAGGGPCICLIAANAPLKFKNPIARLMQPFVGL
jgi:putative transcriptional regulator